MNTLGIDIAKATFEVCLILERESIKPITLKHHFDNNSTGFAELHQWLKEQHATTIHICMEATGVYYEALAEFLHQQGYTVSVVNPWQIKAFGQSQLRRHKNDQQDAQTIAEFCRQQSPEPWQPLSPQDKQLQALARHLEGLQTTCQQQKKRLESCRDNLVADSLRRVIDNLDQEMAQVKKQIHDLIDQDQDLKEKRDLLVTIPGIGEQTANLLLAEIPKLEQFPSAKQLAAYVGLTPSERTSGTSVHGKPRLSKMGNQRVRKFLYLPSLAAIRCNPLIQQLRNRLLEKGKAKMVAVGAAMRKLLHIAYGVLKNRKPFDPTLSEAKIAS